MKLGEQSYVKVNQVRFSQTGDGNSEVCKKCAKEIIDFVKSKEIKRTGWGRSYASEFKHEK